MTVRARGTSLEIHKLSLGRIPRIALEVSGILVSKKLLSTLRVDMQT